jgi:iron-sulfur cluster assembly protein
MLTLTDSAVKHLQDIVGEQEDPSKGLRIYIERGGCAGLSYEMKLDQSQPGDTIVERDGVRLMVDAESLSYLKGSIVDYSDDLTGTGFQIKNPNAVRSCGCGTSFEAAPDPAQGDVAPAAKVP